MTQSRQALANWLIAEAVPALEIKDTRYLTQIIREKGTILGKIILNGDVQFYDPDHENLVAKVSTKKIHTLTYRKSAKNILLIDCGAKKNIQRALIKRGVNVITVPWDFDLVTNKQKLPVKIDGIVISNGPGNPKFVEKTIENIGKLLGDNTPILGICLGHQLLALAAGGDTAKLKYGHRSQNQPCLIFENGKPTKRCFITTQNHGFEVNKIPPGFREWFVNANDGSNEGIIHKKLPIMTAQFHPEATPGPEDTEWIFDYFLGKL